MPFTAGQVYNEAMPLPNDSQFFLLKLNFP